MVNPFLYTTYDLGNVVLDEADCGCGVYTEEHTKKAVIIDCNIHGDSWQRLKHPWPSKTHNGLLEAIEREEINPRIQSQMRIHSKSDPSRLRELVGRALNKANESPRKSDHFYQ